MENAEKNRQRIAEIRTLLQHGHITYTEAKKLAEPRIELINQRGRELSKQMGVTYKPVSFIGLMR